MRPSRKSHVNAAMLEVTPRVRIPLDEIEFTFVRSSGPGGQNVNKVNSKAVMRWPATTSASLPDDVRSRFIERYGSRLTNEGALVVASQRYRDQAKNIDDCLERLREMLLSVATPPKRRRPTRPTRGSIERRLTSKRRRSTKKEGRRSLGD